MSQTKAFDIVSRVNLQEVDNAIHQALKEIGQRFDFKNTNTTIERKEEEVTLVSSDEFKLKNVVEIFRTKLAKRGVSLKALEYGNIESAFSGNVRQVIKINQGIDQEQAKKITKLIRDSKIKVQAMIQADIIRVSGKNKDDLQEAIKLIREANLPINLEFTNYR